MSSNPTESIRLSFPRDDPDAAPTDTLSVRYRPPRDPATSWAILYLHGFGSRQEGEKAAFFRAQAASAGVGFCSFDFRGHGDSGGTMRGLTATRNLADVAAVHAFLRQRGIENVVLMGSSMGGGCALWYAALNPEGIAAAVHIAPALELEVGLERWAGVEGMIQWQRDGFFTFRHELVTCDLSWALIEDLRGFDRERLTATYRTPTLLFQGVQDTSVSWRAVVDFATGCAHDGIELHLFANGDHRLIPHLDHLWRLTTSFLAARGLALASPSTASTA